MSDDLEDYKEIIKKLSDAIDDSNASDITILRTEEIEKMRQMIAAFEFILGLGRVGKYILQLVIVIGGAWAVIKGAVV